METEKSDNPAQVLPYYPSNDSEFSSKPSSVASEKVHETAVKENLGLDIDPDALPGKTGNKVSRYLEC